MSELNYKTEQLLTKAKIYVNEKLSQPKSDKTPLRLRFFQGTVALGLAGFALLAVGFATQHEMTASIGALSLYALPFVAGFAVLNHIASEEFDKFKMNLSDKLDKYKETEIPNFYIPCKTNINAPIEYVPLREILTLVDKGELSEKFSHIAENTYTLKKTSDNDLTVDSVLKFRLFQKDKQTNEFLLTYNAYPRQIKETFSLISFLEASDEKTALRHLKDFDPERAQEINRKKNFLEKILQNLSPNENNKTPKP